MPVIEVRELVKRFSQRSGWRGLLQHGADKTVLDRVCLTVQQGEVFGLLGPNGAGKTTLIKILSTLVSPTSGRAEVCGRDVATEGEYIRRRIGVVYGDERTFFLRLSAVENLRFYAALHGISSPEAERRIKYLLDVVGMSGAAHTRMQHYSTGMKQRVAIARGLLSDPAVLFMDEPTHNLDPVAAREVRSLVRDRVADGHRSVLLATNIMAEAEDLCDRLAILNHGQVQLTGTIAQLRHLLQVEEAHELVISRVNHLMLSGLGAIPGVRSLHVSASSASWHVKLGVERGSSALPQCIRAVVDAGGDIWQSTPTELSLEEMFEIALGSHTPRRAAHENDEDTSSLDAGPALSVAGIGDSEREPVREPA